MVFRYLCKAKHIIPRSRPWGSWNLVKGRWPSGIVATTMRVTVQPRPQELLQAIGALYDDYQPLGCCRMTAVPNPV